MYIFIIIIIIVIIITLIVIVNKYTVPIVENHFRPNDVELTVSEFLVKTETSKPCAQNLVLNDWFRM